MPALTPALSWLNSSTSPDQRCIGQFNVNSNRNGERTTPRNLVAGSSGPATGTTNGALQTEHNLHRVGCHERGRFSIAVAPDGPGTCRGPCRRTLRRGEVQHAVFQVDREAIIMLRVINWKATSANVTAMQGHRVRLQFETRIEPMSA